MLVNLFVVVGNAELSNKTALYTADQKMFAIRTFYCSCGSCVALKRQYLHFALRHREALCTGLLNSLKQQEVCVVNARGDVNTAHLFVRKNLSVQQERQ